MIARPYSLLQGSILPFDASSIPLDADNQIISKTVFGWLAVDQQANVPCSNPRLQCVPEPFELELGCASHTLATIALQMDVPNSRDQCTAVLLPGIWLH